MEHDQRICPRCAKPAGDFHFCPSCLAPIDSLSSMLTSQALRPERALAASDADGDHTAGRDSTSILQVEPDRPSAADVPVPPNAARGEGPELQIRLDGPASAAPPGPRDVARLEDVLTIRPTADGQPCPAAPSAGAERPIRVNPRVSIPPPAPRDVARLEDVLTIRSDDQDARIKPAPAAAAKQAQAAAEAEATPEVKSHVETAPSPASTPPPAKEVQPARASKPQAAERRYVPAYALRAAFWFEQASAFESGTDDDDDVELPIASVAPPLPAVQTTAEVVAGLDEADVADEVLVETPRKHWMLAACLLAVAAVVIALTGRRPCRCSCHGKS